MDLTDIPDEADRGEEAPPDFDDLQSPDSLLKDGPIRERILDVVTALRTPTKVAAIADLADCDTETARDYLEWFTEMGMVHRHDGRPVRYERNDAYFQWRRIDHIRKEYTDREIVDALSDTIEEIKDYQDEFDAANPGDVSLLEASRNMQTETAWEKLSEWETLERRGTLLDAARRDQPVSDKNPGPADA